MQRSVPMQFSMPVYHAPDFSADRFVHAPDAVLVPAPMNGVAPDNYHATTIFPEYFKVGGKWRLAEESRMDCVAVVGQGGMISICEFRRLKAGDMVVVGRTENGSDGIFVHPDGFGRDGDSSEAFAFRTSRSRETSYSRDYDQMYQRLEYEREHGFILWVLGPACSFDSDARNAMAALVQQGYVHGLLAGNALATHDLEGGLYRTALGQDIYTQESMFNGHYHHIDVINKVRRCGSIPKFIEEYNINDGIIHACVQKDIPFVLTGSIRDDGPLPEVVADVYSGQNDMRALVTKATTVICMATQLHTIATGNMTPSFCVKEGVIRPVFFYTVDISEFAVNKLRDRGSLSVVSFIANAQDFLVHVMRGIGKEK
jgi:lysine-ketoglutarate reductase/saccharopine dehydrogenase-like protein (TIGR00300 family)